MTLVIGVVRAVNIETGTYKIECTPETATMQSNGFSQTCTYTLKTGTYTGDVAFCFDTMIRDAEVIYHLPNGNTLDITNQFQYRHYNMIKGECYYIQGVQWNATGGIDSKTIDINYKPMDITKGNKWDTYFGEIAANRIDLKLDPLYDLYTYEIGTNRSVSYYWMNNGGTNVDILNNSPANICDGKVSTDKCVYNRYYTNKGASYTTTIYNNVTVYAQAYYDGSSGTNALRLMGNITYTDGTSDLRNGSCTYRYSSPTFTVASNISKNATSWRVYFDGTGCTGSGSGIDPTIQVVNITQELPVRPYGNVTSTNISSSLLIQSFNMSANYTGDAYINITVDGINYNYLNLSNTSRVTLSDSLLDNSKLSYKIFMMNNATAIYSIMFTLTGTFWTATFSQYTDATILGQNYTEYFANVSTLSINQTRYIADEYLKIVFNQQRQQYVVKNNALLNGNVSLYVRPDAVNLTVQKVIITSNNENLQGALVSIYQPVNGTLKLTYGGITDDSGITYIKAIDGEPVIVTVSKEGYTTKTINNYAFYSTSTDTPRIDIQATEGGETQILARIYGYDITNPCYTYSQSTQHCYAELNTRTNNVNMTINVYGNGTYNLTTTGTGYILRQDFWVDQTTTPVTVNYTVNGITETLAVLIYNGTTTEVTETTNGTISLPPVAQSQQSRNTWIIFGAIILIAFVYIVAFGENKMQSLGWFLGAIVLFVIATQDGYHIFYALALPIFIYAIYKKFAGTSTTT